VLIKIDKTPPEASIQFDPVARTVPVVGRDLLSGVSTAVVTDACVPTAWDDDDDTDNDGKGKKGESNKQPKVDAQRCTSTIVDAAGNKLLLVAARRTIDGKDDETNSSAIAVIVASVQYNNGPVVPAPVNKQSVQWAATKEGTIKELTQTVVIGKGKDRSEVTARFDSHKNETTIEVKAGKPLKIVKSGLTLLRMATNNGALTIEY